MKTQRLFVTGLLVAFAALITFWYLQNQPQGIKKSPTDTRQYRSITLENGLTALLISDPKADRSAAALSVQVGQMQDPPPRQGLAHYLEHMLFLGTEKFPDPDSFGRYLSEQGGETNAFTSLENTNYHFMVNRDHLEPALDRFAQFFVAPLFAKEFAFREVNAVDSEHQKNKMSDFRRIYQLGRSSFNPSHPFSRFSTGSLESLGGEKLDPEALQKDLRDFYEQHYSANLMSLAILGIEPLDQLEQMVKTHFSAIKNKNLPAPGATGIQPILDPLPRIFEVEPIEEARQIKWSFLIPPQKENYREKPSLMISSLLGDEGTGSLLSMFKAKGWASKLNASGEFGVGDFSQFEVIVDLTPEGLKHWSEMTEDLFAYIELIKNEPNLNRYQLEMNRIGALEFQFEDKEQSLDLVRRLATELREVPPEEVLSYRYQFPPLKSGEEQKILARLTPQNMTLFLVAKGLKTNQTEPWYGTQFQKTQPLPEDLALWSHPRSVAGLALPPPNPFIADSAELVKRDQTSDVPQLILEEVGLKLWFEQEGRFNSPKVKLAVYFSSPKAYDSPSHAALAKIYTLMVQEELNEWAYPASVAGLNYRIDNGVRGLELQLEGYPANLPKLSAKVIEAMKLPKIDLLLFERVKRDLTESRQNQRYGQAYHRAIYELYYLTNQQLWHNDDYLAVLGDLTPADLSQFRDEFLSQLHLEVLALGNLSQAQAGSWTTEIKKGLGAPPLAESEILEQKAAQLEPGAKGFQLAVEDNNSAIIEYFQLGPETPAQTATLQLLAQIIEKPAYHRLRTLEQLGYIVWSSRQAQLGVEGLSIIVQSSQRDPVYLRDRIHAFLRDFESELVAMPEAEFNRYRDALAQAARIKPKNLNEEFRRHWSKIIEQDYQFNKEVLLATEVEKTTSEQVQALYQQLTGPKSKALSIEAFAKGLVLKPDKVPLITNKKERKLVQQYYPNRPDRLSRAINQAQDLK
ncbi:MAG: hypothetical protein A2508_02465 [Candidatus Lambdaproteobacteria bacterium RIFOXYD12_FULL_49_8]|nr:MAG: hypothetical protein A2508_02465 [Candidatus Lambdaproteobacteria bacterium RIFOXYD12_FULL_49_8]